MYKLEEMTEEYANIINTWRYGPPYEAYSFDGDIDDFEQIMSGYYFAVVEKEEVVGFFCLGPAAQKITDENEYIFEDESYTDIAFGLRPDLTGKGLGNAFLETCINEAKRFFPEDGVRLCVMKNNTRAVNLYRKHGFKAVYEDENIMVMTIK